MNIYWNELDVCEEIAKFVQLRNIDAIVTFDDNGVSYHPNHISLFTGARYYILFRIFSNRNYLLGSLSKLTRAKK